MSPPCRRLSRHFRNIGPEKQMEFFNESLALYGAKDDAE